MGPTPEEMIREWEEGLLNGGIYDGPDLDHPFFPWKPGDYILPEDRLGAYNAFNAALAITDKRRLFRAGL